jgi:ATP-dependent Clp protease ATP-binding subunit ClpA
VSFKNTLVLLTSNIGSRLVAAAGRGTGGVFGSTAQLLEDDADEVTRRADRVSSDTGQHVGVGRVASLVEVRHVHLAVETYPHNIHAPQPWFDHQRSHV